MYSALDAEVDVLVTFDPTLIVISIAVAVVGSHAGLTIMRPEHRFLKVDYKIRLLLSAVTLGGSIWAMHFIGMHALNLPIMVNYAVLPTFVSALVAIVLTGIGLYVATSGRVKRHPRKLGALCMGAGITSMHFLGMSAIRANCVVENTLLGGAAAFAVGIAASWFALRAVSKPSKTPMQTLRGAVLLGVAISGMHYLAMADTQFILSDGAPIATEPVLNQYTLASVAAFMAFLLCDLFIFIVLPEPERSSPYNHASFGTATGGDAPETETHALRSPSELSLADASGGAPLPISTPNGMLMLEPQNLLSVKAEGHYCEISFFDVRTRSVRQVFSNDSMARVSEKLPKDEFAKAHRSYIVNLNRIARFDRSGGSGRLYFCFRDGPEIPVSRSYVKIIIDRLSLAQ